MSPKMNSLTKQILRNLEIIFSQHQVMQIFMQYLSLDEWLNFVNAFPNLTFNFPHEILLSEDGSPTLFFLLQKKLTQRIQALKLSSPGPILIGGALGVIQKCIHMNVQAFSQLQRLDLSVQMQPIDRLLELFAPRPGSSSDSYFPLLHELSVRPTNPERVDYVVADPCIPPKLLAVKIFLIAFITKEDLLIPKLLQLMKNVTSLIVCERMLGGTPWLHFLRQQVFFPNLESLHVDAKSDLLRAVNESLFLDTNIHFPKLTKVNIGTVHRLKTTTTFTTRLTGPLELSFSGFCQPMEFKSPVSEIEAVHLGRRAAVGQNMSNLMIELIFFPDREMIDKKNSPTMQFIDKFGHLIETLIITVQHCNTPQNLAEYMAFIKRFKFLFHTQMFSILKQCEKSLKSLELPIQLIDSRNIDVSFEAALVTYRGRFKSVRSCSISSKQSFSFCNRRAWHSCQCLDSVPHTQPLKNVCGLFPGLEEFLISSDSHLDPEDLHEVPEVCHNLKKLFINHWAFSLEPYSEAVQELLSFCNIEVLCLSIDYLKLHSIFNERMIYLRSWTLKYLYIDCLYKPSINKEELSRLAKRLPSAKWIMISNREMAKCIEFRRSKSIEVITEMRLDSGKRKEPKSFSPELYDIVWKSEEKMKSFVTQWCHPCEI